MSEHILGPEGCLRNMHMHTYIYLEAMRYSKTIYLSYISYFNQLYLYTIFQANPVSFKVLQKQLTQNTSNDTFL